jgi:hypothetical protein
MNKNPIPLLNPYLELFQSLAGLNTELQLSIRKKLIWAYSWAIPSNEAIHFIAQYTPLVEIGAGTGYWSWLLEQASAQVKAFDLEPGQPPHWHPVEKGDPTAIRGFSDHTLFICWPTLDSDMAIESLNNYSGNHVIYLGEWEGRTANSLFHQTLLNKWHLTDEVTIPVWPNYKDRIYLFSAKKT